MKSRGRLNPPFLFMYCLRRERVSSSGEPPPAPRIPGRAPNPAGFAPGRGGTSRLGRRLRPPGSEGQRSRSPWPGHAPVSIPQAAEFTNLRFWGVKGREQGGASSTLHHPIQKFLFLPKNEAGHQPVLPLLGHVDGVRVGSSVHLLPLKPLRIESVPKLSASSPKRVPVTPPSPSGGGCSPAAPAPTHLRRVEGGEAHRLHHLYLLFRLALQILLCRGNRGRV